MAIIGKEWEASLQNQNRKTNPFLTQTLYTLNPSQRTLRRSEVYREWQASEYTGHRQLLRGRNIRCHETIDCSVIFNSVQLLSRDRLFATPWTAAQQASLSITNSQSLLKLMSIELVMPSNHLILCYPFLLASIFPIIRVFSNEYVLCIRWHESFQWIFRTDFL